MVKISYIVIISLRVAANANVQAQNLPNNNDMTVCIIGADQSSAVSSSNSIYAPTFLFLAEIYLPLE
jgi:hypothetical protein